MAFPWDHVEVGEEVLLDTNPPFSQLLWPLLELLAITGACWLIIGFMDNSANAAADVSGIRQLVVFAWLGLLLWRVLVPVLDWFGQRFVLTNRRIIVRHGILRKKLSTFDLRAVRGVSRSGNMLVLRMAPYGQPVALAGIPGTRKVARQLNRMT